MQDICVRQPHEIVHVVPSILQNILMSRKDKSMTWNPTTKQDQRTARRIQHCLTFLDDTSKNRLTDKLESRRQDQVEFYHTYHELLVRSFLCHHGYTLHYEPSIGEKTPDWGLLEHGDVVCFVEVLTFHADEKTSKDMKAQLCSTGVSVSFPRPNNKRLFDRLKKKHRCIKTLYSTGDM